ncbi:hypothetical protein F5Y11DRAFT_316244 [Daldinia sp. FL1419]|nr:hypothetical protein F5Y11DRAFT_316244 [Daldinia sp. FL1419]
MRSNLFVAPSNTGSKRSRDDVDDGLRPDKRVRREPTKLFSSPRGQTRSQPRRPLAPAQQQTQGASPPVRAHQFFRKRDETQVRKKSSQDQTPDPRRSSFIPSRALRLPSESPSSGTSSSSDSMDCVSFQDILDEISRARGNIEDVLEGGRDVKDDPRPERPPERLTRQNLKRLRKIERERRIMARRNRPPLTLPTPVSPPTPPPVPSPVPPHIPSPVNPPVFRPIHWDRGASQPYDYGSVSPRTR